MDRIRYEELPALFQSVADRFEEKKEELCGMDAGMGDGDLGLTMQKGFGALPKLLRENGVEHDIGKTLVKAGMKMAGLVPSTMGTLMASGIMEGGKALAGKAELGPEELSGFLTGFARGIERRGKCSPGDRTVLDAMDAGARAAGALWEGRDGLPAGAGPDGGHHRAQGIRAGGEPCPEEKSCPEEICLSGVIRAAVDGARGGVEATKEMLPKFGKAAVFSARARGVPDQGAVAGLYFLEGLAEYICR